MHQEASAKGSSVGGRRRLFCCLVLKHFSVSWMREEVPPPPLPPLPRENKLISLIRACLPLGPIKKGRARTVIRQQWMEVSNFPSSGSSRAKIVGFPTRQSSPLAFLERKTFFSPLHSRRGGTGGICNSDPPPSTFSAVLLALPF